MGQRGKFFVAGVAILHPTLFSLVPAPLVETTHDRGLECRPKGANTMNIFQRPKYESNITQFLNELKAKNPEIEVGQRQGMNLLWDKAVDSTAWTGYRAARVAQKPYVYQNEINA